MVEDNEIKDFTEEGEQREIREPRPFPKIKATTGKRDVTDFDIVKEQLKDKLKTKITKKTKKKVKKKALQKAIATRDKAARKAVLQAAIGRQKLLQAVTAKRTVSVLRKIEPRPPSVFIREEPKKERPMFLGKGRLL
ncbi:hypothetical protein LCGC14_1029020 [marine sediment metagenome]|uniref:Uncharacterized protein n=1 Tax=marine sediment metagenome TaxID=412755 RepID=A0A0F9R115_9ZZZZ